MTETFDQPSCFPPLPMNKKHLRSLFTALLLASPVSAQVQGPQLVTAPVRAPRVQFQTFDSAAAKTKASFHIYLPEAYGKEPTHRFPTLYWLHGSGGGLPGIGRIIEGFSMGGYGAARLGFKYPQLFASISILAAGPLDMDFAGPRAIADPAMRERVLKTTFGGDLDYYRSQNPNTVVQQQADAPGHLVMLTPGGRRLDQAGVEELARKPRIVLVCGRYEGFDDRVRETLQPDEISIGDYVLSGGEVAAMVIVDAVARLLPGVLGDEESARQDSFSGADRLVDGPQYTRPREFRGLRVPDVLLSGDHGRIATWRHEQAVDATRRRVPVNFSPNFSCNPSPERS